MSKCPYTWVKNFFKKNDSTEIQLSAGVEIGKKAKELRVQIVRKGEVTVDLSLPAGSARWLIDLIPEDIIKKIKAEEIPIEEIQTALAKSKSLFVGPLFRLIEVERSVFVWLN